MRHVHALIAAIPFSILSAMWCQGRPAPPPEPRPDLHRPVMPVDPAQPYPRPGSCQRRPPPDLRWIELPTPLISQRTPYAPFGTSNNLCWAAVAAMASSTLGNDRTTCRMAGLLAEPGVDCCAFDGPTGSFEAASCNRGAPLWSIGRLLRQSGLYHVDVPAALTEDEIMTELANGRPIIMRIRMASRPWTIQGGRLVDAEHVMVIMGRRDDLYLVNDPDRLPRRELTYEGLRKGPTDQRWEWIGSWYRLSFRDDGCNPLHDPTCGCP